MMRKQLELATTAMEIEPEKFRPQYKVHKIFRVGGVKTKVRRVSGNNNFFRPYDIEELTSLTTICVP